MTRRIVVSLFLVTAVLVAGSCDGPEVGELVVTLETSHTDVGAVVFEITALEPKTLAAVDATCAGCQVFTVSVSEREVRAIVVGSVVPGEIARVTVSDRRDPAPYGVRVLDAAATDFSTIKASEVTLRLPQE